MKRLFFLTLLVLTFTACKKEKETIDTSILVPLSIEFDNIVGGQNLRLNTGQYENGFDESFSVTRLQYYISNISVTNTNGLKYTVPQDSSYFLIKEDDQETRFARVKVPAGDYKEVEFIVGVDSLRSTLDIAEHKGVLDPAADMESGMYWGWNSGYIFFKLEGEAPDAPADPTGQHKIRYHIGGFGGYSSETINNIKTVKLNLENEGIAKAREGRSANIHLLVDIRKAFTGISFKDNPTVMFSQFSVNVANNFPSMFTHSHSEN